MAEKEAGGLDVSQLRTPILISGKPVEQVLSSIHYGSPELRCLLMDECDLIFECKVCRALFRDLPNFISHKRAYCTKSSMEDRHVTIASLPEEKVVVIQPQAPEEGSSSSRLAGQQPNTQRPNLEETILRIQSGELGRSHAYQVYTEAAEKLQRQKEGMKVATIRTTNIPTNKNAVFIDVNMTSVNIHERQQQVSNAILPSYDQNRNDTSVSVIKRKAGERLSSTRNVRKSVRQEKHSSEPQKLLMEQLKEIQHKVKQKVAAAQDQAVQQKRLRNTSQNSGPVISASLEHEGSQKGLANTAVLRVQKKTSEGSGLMISTSENPQSMLDKDEETGLKYKLEAPRVKDVLIKQCADSKMHTQADTEHKLHTVNAVATVKTRKKLAKRSLICSKCNSVFATRKSLGFHVKIHHSAKRTFYPCPYCSSVFYYFFGITRHLFRNHSLTLEEIDGMRKQLREKSYTKPLSTPLLNKETDNLSGNYRSSRTFERHLLSSTSEDICHRLVSSFLSDTPLVKTATDCQTTVSESISTIVQQKNAQPNVSPGQCLHSQLSRSTASEEPELVVSSKVNNNIEAGEPRSTRLKNRHQQRPSQAASLPSVSDHLVKVSKAGVTITSPRVPSPRVPSPRVPSSSGSSFQENTSYSCPKCHRSFRRKISCKNHLTVCKTEYGSTLRSAKSQNIGHRRRITSERTSSRANKPTKVKTRERTSNNVPAKAGAAGAHQATFCLQMTDKKEVRVISPVCGRLSDALRPAHYSQTQASDRNTVMSRRSSSVDRVLKQDEPRNRSHDRSSAVRERDSSVESTQSNVEGKSPRSHRNVLSRYALSSPAKCDSLLTTSLESDCHSNVIENHPVCLHVDAREHSLDGGDNIFSCATGKALKYHSGDDGPQSAAGSEKTLLHLLITSGSEKGAFDLPSVQAKAKTISRRLVTVKNTNRDKESSVLPSGGIHTRSEFTGEVNRVITLHQRSLVSPQSLTSCLSQGSPIKSHLVLRSPSPRNNSATSDKHLFPKNKTMSTDRLVLFQRMPQDSSPEVSAARVSSSGNKATLISLRQSFENTVAKSEFVETGNSGKDPLKLQQGVKLETPDCEHPSVLEKMEILNRLKIVPQVQEDMDEKPGGLLKLDIDFRMDSPRTNLTKETDACIEVHRSNISTEQLSTIGCKNSSGNSKGKDKPAQMVVVSALSERPKRKRKVPSRNRDAEEMLSKILSHNRQTAPGKKRKVVLEAQTADVSEQRRHTDNVKRSTLALTDLGGKGRSATAANEKAGAVGEAEASQQELDISELEGDDDDDEELGPTKGRLVSNRKYVLEKYGSKRKRLKCYDQVKVYKMIDEQKLKCLECDESCSQVSNLRRHVIRQHLKWSRFKCKFCKFESYDRSECATHLIRGHSNRTINLRSVNQYIIDLVKQGSHARSLKKNQTIKVKQQSESQEGNIYARPTVKKMLRLSQRAEDETKSRCDRDHSSGERDINTAGLQSQTRNKELEPWASHNSAQLKSESTHVSVSKQASASVAATSSRQVRTLSSSPKVGTSKQPGQQHTSPKPGLDQSVEGKDASLKIARKSLPFNISTRNSPRTFDTRPYDPDSSGGTAEAENVSVSKKETPYQTRIEALGKVVSSPEENRSEMLEKGISICPAQEMAEVQGQLENLASNEFSSTDDIHKLRNIFDKMRSPPSVASVSTGTVTAASVSTGTVTAASVSTGTVTAASVSTGTVTAASVSTGTFTAGSISTGTFTAASVSTGTVTAASVSPGTVNVSEDNSSIQKASGSKKFGVAEDISPLRAIGVSVEAPHQIFDETKHIDQPLDAPIESVTVNTDGTKAKVISYIIRGPPQRLPHDEVIKSDQLAKSLTKLNELGDQINSSLPSSQELVKTALTVGKVTSAKVIDTANLQRKQTLIPSTCASVVKIPSIDCVQPAPQRSTTTSHEKPGPSSGIVITAALAKGGHMSTTAAPPLILSHGQSTTAAVPLILSHGQSTTAAPPLILSQGQSGKFIILSRPAATKELATVGSSLQNSLPMSSPSSLATSATVAKLSDVKPSSETAAVEVFPPGTFLIRKHYL